MSGQSPINPTLPTPNEIRRAQALYDEALLARRLARTRPIVLICGSRNWTDTDAIYERVDKLPDDALVIEGGARGADREAGFSARERGLFVVEVVCTDTHWHRFGRSAGHKRNHAMLDLAPDLVIAFQRDGSKGTQGTVDEARRRGIPVEVHTDRARAP